MLSCVFSLPSRLRSRYVLVAVVVLALGGLIFLLPAGAPSSVSASSAMEEFRFHHDNILGTSLDLVVFAAGRADAEACAQAVLDEIERLRQILSTYDPKSEISGLNQATGPVPCSPELIEVLRAYELWNERSSGAFNGQLGDLIRTWKEAEKASTLPDAATLERIVQQINKPGWRIDEEYGTVERLTNQPLNVNAIGKGYIIGKAAAAGRAKVPAVQGLLVNIGGDVLALGDCDSKAGWRIGVADPKHPEDNAPPLAELRFKDAAVATSATYERNYIIGSKRYSHIFDPRTGWPAEGISSATVIAPDNVTANALATTLCVLSPEEGLALIEATPGTRCLLVTADGRQLRSAGFKELEVPTALAANTEAEASKWPDGYQVTLTVTLITPTTGKKIRRPYVAVWIEDADGKPIRTLTVWGPEAKYQKDLTAWWKFARNDKELIKAVTRATRPPGRYQIAWDGKDDKGKPVEQGTYTVVVEVHREHGKHVKQSGTIQCGEDKATATLEKTAENEETKVEYGPREK